MTEQEKANARAEKAEAELLAMKAEAARVKAAREIAAREGIPVELVEFCADEDAMERFCKVFKAFMPPAKSVASSVSSRVVREGATVSNRDRFAAFADAQLNHH